MNRPPTYTEKIRRLPWSYVSTSANSVFGTLTLLGTVFILFLDKLGLPKNRIGLVLSLFPFCGVLALFIAPMIIRFGLKRTYILFWGIRKVAAGFVLLTPFMLSRFGVEGAFIYVSAVVLVFAVCRAIAESAFNPWMQEFVPGNILGRYLAVSNILYSLVNPVSIGFAGYVVGRSDEISTFMLVMAVGVFFGIIAVWSAFYIPGGAPHKADPDEIRYLRGMMEPARDRNFRLYVLGAGATAFGGGIGVFIPLYLAHEVGISSSGVVLLSIAVSLGGLASYVWGWASDRYGGKPVLLTCLGLGIVVPLCLIMIPRHSPWTFAVAAATMFGSGFFIAGYNTASPQLMYVSLVPPENKTRYMALHYASMGLVGGTSPILAGVLLERFKGISGHIGAITLDSYTPLFLLSAFATVISALLMRCVRVKSRGQ